MSIRSRRIEAQFKQKFLRHLTKHNLKRRANGLHQDYAGVAMFTTVSYHNFQQSSIRELVKSIPNARLYIASISAPYQISNHPSYYSLFEDMACLKLHGKPRCHYTDKARDKFTVTKAPLHKVDYLGFSGISKKNQERLKKCGYVDGEINSDLRNSLMLRVDSEKCFAHEQQRINTYLSNTDKFIELTARWVIDQIRKEFNDSVNGKYIFPVQEHIYSKENLKLAIKNGEARGYSHKTKISPRSMVTKFLMLRRDVWAERHISDATGALNDLMQELASYYTNV